LILDGVIGIFQWHNPSGRTVALGSTQPLNRNEYQEHFLGVKAAGAQGWQPYHHPVLLSWNLGTLTSWNPLGHSRPVTGLLYIFTFLHISVIFHTVIRINFFLFYERVYFSFCLQTKYNQTNSIQHSASQEIPCILWNPRVRPYPDPDQSSTCLPIPILKDPY